MGSRVRTCGNMLAALILGMVGSPATAWATTPDEVENASAHERAPLLVHWQDNRNADVLLSVSKTISARLEAETGFGIEWLDRSASNLFERCPEQAQVSCQLPALWSQALERHASLLVLGTRRDAEGRTRLLALFLGAEVELTRSGIDDAELATELLQRAAASESQPFDASDHEAFETTFDLWMKGTLARELQSDGRGLPLCRLELEGLQAPTTIALDGHLFATVHSKTQVRDVRCGSRRLKLQTLDEGEVLFDEVVELGRGHTRAVSIRAPTTPPSMSKRAALYSGIGVAAAGLTFTVLGLVRAEDRFACLGDCDLPQPRFARFCDLGSGDSTRCGGLSAVRILPLGAALLLGGGALTVAGAAIDEDVPFYVTLLSGLVGAAAAYGIGLAVE